jgi:hypothetical protein
MSTQENDTSAFNPGSDVNTSRGLSYTLKCFQCGRRFGTGEDYGNIVDLATAVDDEYYQHVTDTGHSMSLLDRVLPPTGLGPTGIPAADLISRPTIIQGPLTAGQQTIMNSLQSMEEANIPLTNEQRQLLQKLKDQALAAGNSSNLPTGSGV